MATLKLESVLMALIVATCSALPTEDRNLPLKVPAECKGKPFCNVEPEGYAALVDKINKAIPPILQQEYDDRFGPESSEPQYSPESDWHNCPSVTTTESIYFFNQGNDNQTKMDVIVQTELLKQYVKVVNCAVDKIEPNTDEQCFQDLGISAFNMMSRCVTTNAKRTLYVYDEERDRIIPKLYDVPACCSCRVYNKF